MARDRRTGGPLDPLRLDCAMCGSTANVAFAAAVPAVLCGECAAMVLGLAPPNGPSCGPIPPALRDRIGRP